MDTTLSACLDTIAGVCQKHGKAYCYPAQITIMGLLKRYHGVDISRRTLNRRLGQLEGSGYFTRTKRHHRARDGGLVFRSTLYKLTGKTFNLMGSLGKRVQRFFGCFRVPKVAQYPYRQGEVSGGHLPILAGNGPPQEKKGCAPGAPPDPVVNLERVRDLLGKITR